MQKFVPLLMASLAVFAGTGQVQAAEDRKQMVLAVSEGTSGGIDNATAVAKYQPLADVMGLAMHADVKVVFVREFRVLREGIENHKFDFVLARPSNYPATGMASHKYQFVATATPEGQCMLIAHKDSAIKTVADIKDKKVVLPEETAYMTTFCLAELRDQGLTKSSFKLTHVREQGAIPFAVENKIIDVGGVASYSGAYKQWVKAGHRVVHQSRPQPYMPMVAAPQVSSENVSKVQASLTKLTESDAGNQVLARVGVKGFLTTEEPRLRKLLQWLGT